MKLAISPDDRVKVQLTINTLEQDLLDEGKVLTKEYEYGGIQYMIEIKKGEL